jgi:hypothetical protein
MADNVGITPGSGAKAASREVTYSGETAQMQVVGLATFDGSDDAKTVADISLSNPMPVQANQSDDLIRMLSRLVKILESNAVVDSAQRQRIAVDSFIATIPTITTVTTLTTLTTCSTVSSVTNIAANAGMDREQYINIAKQTYTQSIRNRLEFV